MAHFLKSLGHTSAMKYTTYYANLKHRKQIYITKQSKIAKKWRLERFSRIPVDESSGAVAPGIPAKAFQNIRRGELGSVLPSEKIVADENTPQDRECQHPKEETVPNFAQ